jgi:hypothetical protein
VNTQSLPTAASNRRIAEAKRSALTPGGNTAISESPCKKVDR